MNKMNKFLADKRGDIAMVNAGIFLVVLLTVLYVGINIIDNVQDASAIDTEWNETAQTGDRFYDTQNSLLNTTESSYSMAGIMPIVMIAVAVLGGLLSVLYLFARRD
ncbi:MAG: hypothetical protein J7K40_05845 [candidate division Zixibacteria bacterium]|nr:hypothetical protein [candidate division Zixibacteria bacterium]MCD6161919.1 hypothetical protein [candidate division Zixibacteria bacterium]